MPLRVWAEFLPYEEAAAPATLQLLRRFDVSVCLSVPDGALGHPLARLLHAYADAGLAIALWLLLPKSIGYWPSERNAAAFSAHLDTVFAWAAAQRVRAPWIAVDLELPLPQALAYRNSQGLKQILAACRIALANLNARRFAQAVEQYRAILSNIHAHGAKALCAAHDSLVEDFDLGAPIVQDFLETPVVDVEWDVVSTMIYNSMIVDEHHIAFDDARWLQYELACQLKRAFGARAGLSLGLTGVGVLGDEAHYTDPTQLAPDIAAAKAAGIDDIALFNLEGILRSPDPAAWFQVALETAPQTPRRTAWAAKERAKRRRLARSIGWWRWR
ncbi:MAG TPA: hypothetical protein VJG32_03495 [Anaerolineae bacterium]|nr:hypothetical protein [Anaerolineae bacterium]